VAAARAGDAPLLTVLLAPEAAPDEDDLSAITEAAELDDGSRLSLEQVCPERPSDHAINPRAFLNVDALTELPRHGSLRF
jgi:hypothetical protein